LALSASSGRFKDAERQTTRAEAKVSARGFEGLKARKKIAQGKRSETSAALG